MKPALLLALAAAMPAISMAAGPSPADFAWHAPVEVPAAGAVVRARLPAGAFAASRSADLRDVRVFNGASEAVPFTLVTIQDAPAPGRTPPMRALPLYASTANRAAPRNATRVRIESETGASTIWVQNGEPPGPGARPLDAVLVDTREQSGTWAALEVDATLPPNTPVRLSAWTSADLAQWEPVPLRGRIFRFEGDQAPANKTLAFESPRSFQGRYLRLDWQGQAGVRVAAVSGVPASSAPPPRVELPLSLHRADGGALEAETGTSAAFASLELRAQRENALVPVRVLIRPGRSQPWRLVSQGVVYRLGAGADLSRNGPFAFAPVSALQVRIEPTHGANLEAASLQASAGFDPVQVVFVASGAPPFTLASGLAGAVPVALPQQALVEAQGGKALASAPEATVGAGETHAAEPPGLLGKWWPAHPDARTGTLWALLAIAVFLLAAAAFALMRQIDRADR